MEGKQSVRSKSEVVGRKSKDCESGEEQQRDWCLVVLCCTGVKLYLCLNDDLLTDCRRECPA